jgi:dephospho-CoA kinase
MRFGRPQIPEISLQRDLAELKSLNMAPAILLADYFIENNGSMEELTGKIDAVLKNLKEEDEQG